MGTHTCAPGPNQVELTLSRVEANLPAFYEGNRTGGACSIQVTAAAPNVGDVVRGTFTATLVDIGNAARTLVVTEGAFEVPRLQ